MPHQSCSAKGGTGNACTPGPNQGSSSRILVEEIASRLNLGRQAVYAMLEQRIIPGVRLGRRWIITRQAYETWERTCGMRSEAGHSSNPEVNVVN
jgi:excisionase family DNA binding protein